LILRDGKPFHFQIRLAFVVAEHFRGIVAGSHAGPANAQPHLRRMKQFMKQCLTSRRIELIEHVAGGIGECCAESEHLLELLAGIEQNRVVVAASRASPR